MVNIFWTLKETSRATKGKTSGFFDTLPQLYKDDWLAGLPPCNIPKCRPYRHNNLKGTGDLIPEHKNVSDELWVDATLLITMHMLLHMCPITSCLSPKHPLYTSINSAGQRWLCKTQACVV